MSRAASPRLNWPLSAVQQQHSSAAAAAQQGGYEIPARLRTLHNLVIQYASQGPLRGGRAPLQAGPGGPGEDLGPRPP